MKRHVRDWYQGTVRTRLLPRSAIVLIHTRWVEDDLIGEQTAKQPDRWVYLNFRAVAECDETIVDVVGEETAARLVAEGIPLPAWSRREGEALWPETVVEGKVVPWYDLEELGDVAAELSVQKVEAMYQGRPAAESGNIIERGWWQRWTPANLPSRFDQKAISVDCAFKDTRDSDYVAIGVWGRSGADCYLLHQVRDRLSFTATVDQLVAVHRAHRDATAILVEDKANGPAVISQLQRKVPGLIPVTPDGSKESRVHAASPWVRSGNVWIPAEARWDVDGYVEEHALFPNARNDDQVDQTTQMLLWWAQSMDHHPIRAVSAATPRGRRRSRRYRPVRRPVRRR